MSSELVRVLISAPDRAVQNALSGALPRAEGYDAVISERVGELLAPPRGSRMDALLLQLQDPPKTGLEPVSRALVWAQDIPVVAVLAPEHRTFGLRAVQLGCADHLTTDELDPPTVRRAVRYAVDLARSGRRRLKAERALADSEQRYRSLFEQSRDAIFMTERDGEIMEINGAASDLLGFEVDEFIGRSLGELYADREDWDRFLEEIQAFGHARDFEARLRGKDGSERWCLISSWVRRNSRGGIGGFQGILHDISARKAAEDQLAHEALHDSLTGLPNRVLFMDRLERAVARRRRGEERDLALLFLDVDRFKIVNDSLGHSAGDELLVRIGRLLSEEIRQEDTVARIGGDEFAILIDGVDDPSGASHVAERIQERFRTPFQLQGGEVFTSVSVGIAVTGTNPKDPGELLQDADTAMYRAKALGPARFQIFDPAMHVRAQNVLQLETDLRRALDRREFVVHYQPLVAPDTGRISGFEALVRWQHPEHGLILPHVFIPSAEENGLIVPLGTWVLRTAIAQLRKWRSDTSGLEDLFMAVNLSTRQFVDPDLAGTIAGILAEEGISGESLHLEITESAMLRSPGAAIESLRRLQDEGVVVCIDDFGTGFSSLNALHTLPVDVLKIDRAFISRLEEENEGEVVATILTLARNLGLQAVAEGVETEGQRSRLVDLGSVSVQGFLFSNPLKAEAAGRLLATRTVHPGVH